MYGFRFDNDDDHFAAMARLNLPPFRTRATNCHVFLVEICDGSPAD